MYIVLLLAITVLLYKLHQVVQLISKAIIEIGLHLESESNYPATEYGLIKRQRKELSGRYEEYLKAEEKVESFKEHDDTHTPNKDKSDAYKDAKKEYFIKRAQYMDALNCYRTMVESNWLVKSGKKTIEEADERKFHDAFALPSVKARKMFDKWLEQTEKS